jgi:hypothetical protein
MSTEAAELAAEAALAKLSGVPQEPQEEPEEEYEAGQEPAKEGDEAEPEEVKEEPKAEEPEFVEVEFDGDLYEVPPKLKDALMMQQDYTQKTQAVANDRKGLEVTMGQLEQTRLDFEFAQEASDTMNKIAQIDQGVEQYRAYLHEQVEHLSHTDIEKIRIAIDQAQAERDKMVNELQQKQTDFQQAREQSHKELLEKGTDVLRGKIPSWGESHQKQMQEYALKSGFTEQEISSLIDPRQVEVLWKAAQYDALQEGKKPAVLKAQAAIKPKSRNPMPKEVGDKLNLRKQLKSEKLTNKDKGEALGDHIARKFNM